MPRSCSASARPGALLRDGVRQRREGAAQPRQRPRVAERARLEAGAVTLPVAGQELALEARHVHADRALGLARAALEAQVERVVDAAIVEPGVAETAGHRQAQDVGAAARGVLFVVGRHVRRAHRALDGLAAGADAAAHLDRAAEAAVVVVVEVGRGPRRHVAGAVAQVGGHRSGVDDLAGIEQACRIEGLLDGAEGVVEHRPEHLADERAAHEAVAVLARERAAEFEHEIGDVASQRLEAPHAFLGLEVDDRPDVEAADRGVGVDAGLRAVGPHRRRGTGRCSRAAAPAARPCPRRTRATWRRPSSPSTARARLRAGPRCAPASAGRARGRSGSRTRGRAGPLRAQPGAAAGTPPRRRRTRRTAARRARPR